MLSLYALGIVAAVVTAFMFKRTLLKGPATSFILELPTYKLPQASQVARQVWTNTWAFITKAGTTIFCLSVILWAMTYYPRLPQSQANEVVARVERAYNAYPPEQFTAQNPFTGDTKALTEAVEKAVGSEQLRYSVAGRLGHVIEPVIRPLGFDWKMGVGLVGAFAAREVFVSTMAIVYNAGSEDDTADLATAMKTDTRPNGKPVWTPLIAASLLVWFVLAMQCMSTLAIVRRETGGWRWPLAMLLYMNALAYVACLIVYQVGRVLA
jgi:ferrous iron transport protein B